MSGKKQSRKTCLVLTKHKVTISGSLNEIEGEGSYTEAILAEICLDPY